MKNFLRNNYGLVVGALLGFFIPLPFGGVLLGGTAGLVYHFKPEWLKLQNFKPKADAWVNRMLEGKQDHPSIR